MAEIFISPALLITIIVAFVVLLFWCCLCCGKCQKSGPSAQAQRPPVATVSRSVESSQPQTREVQNNPVFQLEDLPPSYEEAVKMKPLPFGQV
ncbi:hypothetical protein HOLleu_17515 [Holothuria leucospilota]|uniref:Uncharacterized protein n=1 Tax=Holothuria leucospilota TaxID=206669 RepID=A0A9Q1C1E1_HOLLE|nr:hypothetical protein HOLleu_17515 [Holothuria leucospilota]